VPGSKLFSRNVLLKSIHVYMEMSQGNSLCSYLSKKNKNVLFYFYKIGEQVLFGGRVGTSGRGEEVGKECRRVNIVQILCTHVCKWKSDGC
jgi:hypothetical protein